jgi:seryl-tRNA synthetase
MLDLKYVRQHQAEVEANVKRRKSQADVAKILDLDAQRSRRLTKLEQDRAELKAASKTKPDAETIVRLRTLGEDIRTQEAELRQVEYELQMAASWLPNMSSPDMPVGQGEEDNVDIAAWVPGHGPVETDQLGLSGHLRYGHRLPSHQFGDGAALPPPTADNGQRQHHLDVGEDLGIIDMAQGAKVAGTRFVYLAGAAAELENAIVQLLATKLLQHDFLWMDPPLMVQEAALFGTSHFPEGRDQVYQVASEHVEEGRQLYLVGSSEPSLFAFGMDRVFTADQLPLKMFAVTPCFRSEVGSWGRDVRGIKRVHQFNKLEMDVIATPDTAEAIFEELLGYNQWLLQQLELPYRVVNKCTGDCGYLATYKQYDVEVWMPSQQEFMETMTDTWATDFQARRLNIRYTTEAGQREYVHTVNDTGAALGRLVAAILDNFQQPDGTVVVPEVLRPWLSTDVIRPNKLSKK